LSRDSLIGDGVEGRRYDWPNKSGGRKLDRAWLRDPPFPIGRRWPQLMLPRGFDQTGNRLLVEKSLELLARSAASRCARFSFSSQSHGKDRLKTVPLKR